MGYVIRKSKLGVLVPHVKVIPIVWIVTHANNSDLKVVMRVLVKDVIGAQRMQYVLVSTRTVMVEIFLPQYHQYIPSN